MEYFEHCFNHNGEVWGIEHHNVSDFGDIEDSRIEKIHALCLMDGKLLLVHHPRWNIWSIPGGSRESGETIEQTLHRELEEETNCQIVSMKPISYQKAISPSGEYSYRVQYLCMVKEIGVFEKDPAENIDKIHWIDPAFYSDYIENKPFRHAVFVNLLKNI
jgi:8-oxo-dGTP pyrophosphatase MutT (NUDIX family)